MEIRKPEGCDLSGKAQDCKRCFNCKVCYDSKKREAIYYNTKVGKHAKLHNKGSKLLGRGKKLYKLVTAPFKFIEGHKWIKIASIVLFLVVGVYMRLSSQPPWNKLNIIPDADYLVYYSRGNYLIESDKEEISLKVGVTDEVESFYIIEKLDGKEAQRTEYSPEDTFNIVIDKNAHYKLGVVYKDGKGEEISFRKK